MLGFMDRSAIKLLKKKGKSISEIAVFLGHDRKTVRRVLREAPDRRHERKKPRRSKVERFRERIEDWLKDKVPVKRMLELCRIDPEDAYKGSRSVFYAFVARLRRELGQEQTLAPVRFEGLPGEFLQVDWGEKMLSVGHGKLEKFYFLCCRLKYSRFMFVEFHRDMSQETLIRSLLRCFTKLGGVPWQLVFDNMKTVTLGRDDKARPVWNRTFEKFAAEMDFSPAVCWPRSPEQKGSVENLVGYVKSNFLAGRSFHDEEDLKRELESWLERVNNEPCQAQEGIPSELLAEREREKFSPLPRSSSDYGMLHLAVASRESLVHFATNAYSVPVRYRSQSLTVRIHEQLVRIYDDATLVAEHRRSFGRKERVIEPVHFEPVFEKRPRARVMLYRDVLSKLDPQVERFLSELCRRRRGQFGPQILSLYRLWQRHGEEEFLAAVDLALEQATPAAEYVEALLEVPPPKRPIPLISVPGVPQQEAVDRSLELYERFVHGRRAEG